MNDILTDKEISDKFIDEDHFKITSQVHIGAIDIYCAHIKAGTAITQDKALQISTYFLYGSSKGGNHGP